MRADQCDVDPTGDHRFERRISRRLAEAVEFAALQVRDPGGELEPQQGAERKDMIGITSAIGVMPANRDVTLVVEQPVEDIECFTRGRRDRLRAERSIAVGDVGTSRRWKPASMCCTALRSKRRSRSMYHHCPQRAPWMCRSRWIAITR
jgi:hypothetical protein